MTSLESVFRRSQERKDEKEGNGLLLIIAECEAISFIKLRDSSPRKLP